MILIGASLENTCGELLLRIGSAILGAGVFAVIMKSAQFTELFQNHIANIFYRPDKALKKSILIERWEIITKSLLNNVIPITYKEATDKIKDQYIETKMEYHFQSYYTTYDISVDDDSNWATIKVRARTTLALAPGIDNPQLIQTYFDENSSDDNEDQFKLLALYLNNVDLSPQFNYKKKESGDNAYELRVPLVEYVKSSGNGIKEAPFEKVLEWKQEITKDPFIKVEISRYIKGLTVRYKITDKHKIHFRKFGLGETSGKGTGKLDGEGYMRWDITDSDTLLLPGQGFIMVISPI
nr:hypothetical protein [uncultured Desulfobacter sp.]